jgi:hypothetical protein
LTRDQERQVSREWTMHGALVDLVGVVARNVFEGRRSAPTPMPKPSTRVRDALDSPPALKPTAIDAMRNKAHALQRPAEASSDAWRRRAADREVGAPSAPAVGARAG